MGVRRTLRKAADDRAFVTVHRSPRHATTLSGFVVAVGPSWSLLQRECEGGYFDGFVAFRTLDVTKTRRDETYFGATFARSQPGWPPAPPDNLCLDSDRDVIRSLSAHSPLIGIEMERRPSAMWVGELVRVGKRRTWLSEVRPDATWNRQCSGYLTRRITAVSVGGLYLSALRTIASDAPVSPGRVTAVNE